MAYGYKCPRCGEIVRYCSSEAHVEETGSNENPLRETFYCVGDGEQDFFLHFCRKKCIPKQSIKKVKGKLEYASWLY